MTGIPFVAVNSDELGEPTETIRCKRCGETHAIEYGTSKTLQPDGTWSDPVASKLLGFYTCTGKLYVGTIDLKRWK